MRYVSCADAGDSKTKPLSSNSWLGTFVTFIATVTIVLPNFGVAADLASRCLVRESHNAMVNREDTYAYEHKLFVTPDEMARYVFLTNRSNDGDRSAGVYLARHKKGSLPGDYWLPATVAADSLREGIQNVRVRRYDAPLPASTANVLHKLWLAVIGQSRKDDGALPTAPTGILSVVTESGARLNAVTISLDQELPCYALINVGESLIEYAKLPATKRLRAAAEIENKARHLLQRNK